MRKCTGCLIDKPDADFAFHNRGQYTHGKRSKCRECYSKIGKKYVRSDRYRKIDKKRRKNPLRKIKFREYVKKYLQTPKGEISRQNSYLKKFGINALRYKALFKQQMGRCAICGMHQSKTKRRLFVDHCHKTNVIRGLLCHQCNSGLGFFRDRTEYLKYAIKYLNRSRV